MNSAPLTPDLCVIGAGSAGLSVAAAAAAFGVPAVLIERGAMGGECLNSGCVPSKALLAAAAHAQAIRDAPAFGVSAGEVRVDFAKVRAHVRGVIAAIAPNDSEARFRGLGVHVIKADARFLDADTLDAGGTVIKARRFVIATGSTAAVPPIPGLKETPYLTNETIFDLDECPRHLLILGGGPIGMEMAQAFRRLGAQVTVIEAKTALAKDDPECAGVVIDQLAREGVTIREGASVERVSQSGGDISLTLKGGETIMGSHLLVAAGRKPIFDTLDLHAAGIKSSDKGITVDAGLRTSNARVYAIGDVTGDLQFTHAANYQAGLVIRNALFRLPVRVKRSAVPWVTYTHPELAQAGLTEDEARKQGHAPRILRSPFHENDRAQAERETRGHIKLVLSKRGKLLGATIVGEQAGELIATYALAIDRNVPLRVLAGLVLPYPTRAEIGKRAVLGAFASSLTNPWVRRIIAFLRKFG